MCTLYTHYDKVNYNIVQCNITTYDIIIQGVLGPGPQGRPSGLRARSRAARPAGPKMNEYIYIYIYVYMYI